MHITKKTTYPAYTGDLTDDIVLADNAGNAMYRTHEFDQIPERHLVKKWRKDTIREDDAPLRGQMPLRPQYYRANESKIPATTRLGLSNK